MMRTPLQLLSLFKIIPPVTECAHDSEENAKREFGWQNVEKERLSGIYTFRFRSVILNVVHVDHPSRWTTWNFYWSTESSINPDKTLLKIVTFTVQ